MEAAADKTYISKRILEQYAKERKQRLEKRTSKMVPSKTFAEDSDSQMMG